MYLRIVDGEEQGKAEGVEARTRNERRKQQILMMKLQEVQMNQQQIKDISSQRTK